MMGPEAHGSPLNLGMGSTLRQLLILNWLLILRSAWTRSSQFRRHSCALVVVSWIWEHSGSRYFSFMLLACCQRFRGSGRGKGFTWSDWIIAVGVHYELHQTADKGPMSRDNVYLGPTMVECQPGSDSVLCTGWRWFTRIC